MNINAGYRNAQEIIWDLMDRADHEMVYGELDVLAYYLWKERGAALKAHVDLYHTSFGFDHYIREVK